MSRGRKIVAWSMAGLALALVAGALVLNSMMYGIPAFVAWRWISPAAHGGQRAPLNGISLYYETYGEGGTPLLVIHGAASSLETMHPFIRGFAGDRLVIAPDSREQGRSTGTEGELSYAAMGADMIALMDALRIPQVDVIGWSDGGIVALDMAMKHPDRVRRLVAIGANVSPDGVQPGVFTEGAMDDIVAEAKSLYDLIAPDPSHFPVLIQKIETMITTQPHYSAEDLSRIRARALIVAGENDIILRAHTDMIAGAIPGAEEMIVPGAPHEGPLTMRDTYVAIARNFLDRPTP